MRNILFLLFATLPFCFPSLYANLPPKSSLSTFCPPGFRTDVNNEDYCVPCQSGTYNHGQMPRGRTKCYSILQREIALANSTAVKCQKYWTGKPVYIDGEYQYGCYDAGEETDAPTAQYSVKPLLCGSCPYTKKPTPYPTKFPTKKTKPTKYPTRFPTKYPTKKPTAQTPHPSPTPTKIPAPSPTRAPSQLPTKKPTSKPSKKPSKKKKKPTPYPTVYPTKEPTKQPIPPPPPDPHHTIIIHHHGDDDDNGDSTNKYDMAIAGIVVSAIVLIIGAFLCYKKKMKKNKFRREQDRISRNIRLSSNIELPDYRSNQFVEPVIMGSSIQPQATQLPVGIKIDSKK